MGLLGQTDRHRGRALRAEELVDALLDQLRYVRPVGILVNVEADREGGRCGLHDLVSQHPEGLLNHSGYGHG